LILRKAYTALDTAGPGARALCEARRITQCQRPEKI